MHVSAANRAVNGCARSWRRAAAAVAVAVVLLAVSACSGAGARPVPALPSGSPLPKLAFRITGQRSREGSCDCGREPERLRCCGPHAVPHVPGPGSMARRRTSMPFRIHHCRNYLVLARPDRHSGVTDDDDPAAHRLHGPSLFGSAGGRWSYSQDIRRSDAQQLRIAQPGMYAVRHNPWTYFDDRAERAACNKFDVPSGSPNAGAFSTTSPPENCRPSVCSSPASATTVTTARRPEPTIGLRSWLPIIMKGPEFTSRRSAIVITLG